MFKVQTSEFIKCSVEDAFLFFFNKENLTKWGSTTLSVKCKSDSARALGAIFYIVEQPPIPTMPKAEFEYTCTSFEKNKAFAGSGIAVTNAPIKGYNDYFAFEPHKAGTIVTMREELRPRGIFIFLQPMMRIMVGKIIRGDLTKAKVVLEGRT